MLHALNKERFHRIVKRCQRSREVARSAEQNNWGSCEAFVSLGSYSRGSLARDSFPCVIIVALTLMHASLALFTQAQMFSFTALPQVLAEISRESDLASYFSSAFILGVPTGNNSIILKE